GQAAAVSRLRGVLLEMHQRLEGALSELETNRREVLPLAEEALEIGQAGFRAGRFTYLEIAEAQRAVLEIRQQMIVSAHTSLRLVTEMERLTGQTVYP
ncbi:MAG: TolC family protein, partial [Chloroflexi bacterium]|nr:TolC family protein [Chloroflexota bacterium]